MRMTCVARKANAAGATCMRSEECTTCDGTCIDVPLCI
jgi:hypothetical protein